MNRKKIFIVLLLALAALTLSACSGQPLTNNWPGLAANAEYAYLSTGSFIYAVDASTGKEVWKYPAEPEAAYLFYATPVFTEDGQLLIGSVGTTHAFISLDPATGKENWSEPFLGAKGTWVASPLVLNETIYAPNTDGFLYILDLNGKQVADPIELGGALWSAPATDGELLYVTSLDHHLHIINPVSGEAGEPIDLGGASPGSPIMGEGGAYIGSFASTVEFVTSNGNHEVVATASNWIWGTPTLDNNTLYFGDLSGNLYSLDLASGAQNWGELKPDGPVVASLLVAGDQIYAGSEEGTFIALDRDGKIVWEKELGGKIYTPSVLSGDLILVAPYQAEFALAAYDAEGKQAWTFTPEK
ncbi:MAG: PQQ-like beta-propeller repeat protein [Anaerolineae bacterium]|nr:PQQ-like beta-propeller repeat protein [Anaerolineae bacterium]